MKRTLSFSRKGKTSATITDQFEFSSPKRIGTALITFGTFKRLDDRRLLIEADGSAVIAELDSGGIPFQITEETLDEHTATGRVVRRIGIDLATPVERATISIHIEPVSIRDYEAIVVSGGGIESGDISNMTRVKAEEAVGETSPKIEKAHRSLAGKNAFYLWGTEGHAAEWHFDVPASDTYALCLRYASGFSGLSRRKVELDGRSIAPDSEDMAFSFPPTGGWGEKDDQWQTRALAVNGRPLGIQLKKGRHIVRIINVSRAGMNLESLELVAIKGTQAD